jgi:hypothetical protein
MFECAGCLHHFDGDPAMRLACQYGRLLEFHSAECFHAYGLLVKATSDAMKGVTDDELLA